MKRVLLILVFIVFGLSSLFVSCGKAEKSAQTTVQDTTVMPQSAPSSDTTAVSDTASMQ